MLYPTTRGELALGGAVVLVQGGAVSVAMPATAVTVTGTIRFPNDKWTWAKRGLRIQGGGLQFDETGVFLMPGTQYRTEVYAGEINNATRNGDMVKLAALLKGNPELVFGKDDAGVTPLHQAAAGGHRDVAELLLANHAEVDAMDDQLSTPLHWAARRGHKEVVELLLAHNAAVNAKNNLGMTPLHLAAHGSFGGVGDITGTTNVAALLLAAQADVNARNADGATPLYIAAWAGHKAVVELLLANQADVNARANDFSTPLRRAEQSHQKDVAKLLRQHGGH
jgi:ankyrin repeat protein